MHINRQIQVHTHAHTHTYTHSETQKCMSVHVHTHTCLHTLTPPPTNTDRTATRINTVTEDLTCLVSLVTGGGGFSGCTWLVPLPASSASESTLSKSCEPETQHQHHTLASSAKFITPFSGLKWTLPNLKDLNCPPLTVFSHYFREKVDWQVSFSTATSVIWDFFFKTSNLMSKSQTATTTG